jgi:dihydropteroate synthase
MSKPKGGRGKVAPYRTRQVRVPEPVIDQVDNLIEEYQSYIASGGDSLNPPKLLNKPIDKFIEKQEIVSILQEALVLKANAGGAIKQKIRLVLEILNCVEDKVGTGQN